MKIGRFVCQDGGTSKIENERKLCGVPLRSPIGVLILKNAADFFQNLRRWSVLTLFSFCVPILRINDD